MTADQLIIASKSAWNPAIRREHALARLARDAGHRISFLEAPTDLRALRRPGRRQYLSRKRGWPAVVEPGIAVSARRALAPPHRARLAEVLERAALARTIARAGSDEPSTVVATLPWHWPAVAAGPAHRRVLDVADDWTQILPHRAARIRELYRRAGAEADSIVIVSEHLRELFPDRRVTVVRNGTDSDLLASPTVRPPGRRRLAYVGTLSERFDAQLVGDVLDLLPGWSVELWGQCRYARKRDQPGSDLVDLLARPDARAIWHGVVPRTELGRRLDGADVLLLPNRALVSRGQDSMKIYDYAARGRPVIATRAAVDGISALPPHLYLAASAREFAERLVAAVSESSQCSEDRREWCARQTWPNRWPQWADELFVSDRGGSANGETAASASRGLDAVSVQRR